MAPPPPWNKRALRPSLSRCCPRSYPPAPHELAQARKRQPGRTALLQSAIFGANTLNKCAKVEQRYHANGAKSSRNATKTQKRAQLDARTRRLGSTTQSAP